jgi:hypothetical protein
MKQRIFGLNEHDHHKIQGALQKLNRPDQIPTRERHRKDGAGYNLNYAAPFALSLDDEKNIVISPGFLNRNGEFMTTEEKKIKPATGYVCVCSTIVGIQWTPVTIEIHEKPDVDKFPIGYCTVGKEDRNAISLIQYLQSVAIIIITQQCPIIESVSQYKAT